MARPALTAGSQRLRIALAVPALLGIFAFGEAILNRRVVRLDLSPEKRYSLSDHAQKILDTLPADVRVLAFLRAEDPRNPLIQDLLRTASARTPRLRVDMVDVNRSPALARQYGVSSYGAIAVESDGRRRVFSNPREEVLMGALLQVTRQQRKTVGWVVGHGEGDPSDSDRYRGFSTARALLEQEYYEVRPVSLMADEIPPEVEVLLIVGAKKDFLSEELAALDRYLQRPGQAVIMLDPLQAPALADMLRRYYVGLRPDIVIDPAARIYGGEYLTMQVPISRGLHPILGPLEAPPLFSLTRSVDVVAGEPGTMASVSFLRTTEDSWATTDTRALETGMERFVAGRDRRGPIPVGAEVAYRVVTPPGSEPAQGRLVVYGNSEFANNFFIEFLGNKDLFVNTVSWLARDPQAVSRRPVQQAFGVHQFFVSAEQGDRAFWTTAVLEPALFALVGTVLAVRRRWA